MKNLLAYTPETFDNLELENFEYAPLAGEMDMEEGFVRGKQSRPRMARVKTMPRRSIASAMRKPSRIPRLPQIPPRQPMRPLLPPRIGAAASVNVFPPADDRRPSGQSSSSGNAGGEGSFANAPAQDVSSEHVRWVQETLNRALGLRLIVDGIMNRETRSAVRMFQERKGLPVTGLVGPDTEEALRAEGGQAAAEPELLEGEWEMPGSGECSCGGREMEEFVFEAEPFNYAEFGELESESTPPVAAPRVLTYTTKDVIDKRISVPAQHSLVRLSKNPATSADAVGMLQAVKSGQLAGIYCVNWEIAAKRAERLGKAWWTVVPKGEDSVIMMDPDNKFGAPIIAFRRELDLNCGLLKNEKPFSVDRSRLDNTLIKAWRDYIDIRTYGYCNMLRSDRLAAPSAFRSNSVVLSSKSKTIIGPNDSSYCNSSEQPICGDLKLLNTGIWHRNTYMGGVKGGQIMRFSVKNLDVLNVKLTITVGKDWSESRVLAGGQEEEIEFSQFGAEPMAWNFGISFMSIGRGISVAWSLCSTWSPR